MGELLRRILGGPIRETIESVGGVIDSLSTSTEEKLAAKQKLLEIQSALTLELARMDAQLASEQAGVIRAEASSESWLARNWRPILMLVFTFIVAWNYIVVPIFSLPVTTLDENVWELLKLGVGGYIIGRSAEKTAATFNKQ